MERSRLPRLKAAAGSRGSSRLTFQMLDENGIRRRRIKPQIGEGRIGKPLPDLVQAPGDGRERNAGLEQLGKLPCRSQVAEAIGLRAAIKQSERGQLLDHVGRQAAQ